MSKKIFIVGLVITSSLVLSSCLTKKVDNQNQDPVDTKTENKSISFGTLNELMDSNSTLHCTWSFDEGGMVASGEIYSKGKKFNQTATYKEASQEINIVSVSDGEWMYMWNSIQGNTGSKIEISKLDDLNEQTESDGTGQKMVNLNKDINLNCSSWIFDKSKFVPPSDIEFMDLTQMLTQTNEMMQDGSMCAGCNFIPEGSEREECLKSLNCN